MPKRVAFYVRVSTSDGQTTENQLRQLHEVADRSGWIVTAVFRDDGISGAKGPLLLLCPKNPVVFSPVFPSDRGQFSPVPEPSVSGTRLA
ncbi:hypothetical protein MRSR164_15055 [Methylobacterium radiotolerans]|uniref:Resolvase/invertase-type recombinase catalytic domain-containing protein n=1 Tax=Methylobacterium radiotolerans TaxID=31998 RepID=A0ABU7TCM0_9HYPH